MVGPSVLVVLLAAVMMGAGAVASKAVNSRIERMGTSMIFEGVRRKRDDK